MGHTLFLDLENNRVYKVIHNELNQTVYWLLFVLILAVLRAIESVSLSMDYPVLIIGLLVFEVIVGVFMGVAFYRSYYKNLKEVFMTKSEIEDYIEKSRSQLKIEFWIVIVLFIITVISLLLFIIFKWLIWNLLTLISIFILILNRCRMSKKRIKLYSKNNK